MSSRHPPLGGGDCSLRDLAQTDGVLFRCAKISSSLAAVAFGPDQTTGSTEGGVEAETFRHTDIHQSRYNIAKQKSYYAVEKNPEKKENKKYLDVHTLFPVPLSTQ